MIVTMNRKRRGLLRRVAMHVEFFSLGLVLRASGKRLLRGVTGQVRHSRLTAVMGPSGAGARRFLATLAVGG